MELVSTHLDLIYFPKTKGALTSYLRTHDILLESVSK